MLDVLAQIPDVDAVGGLTMGADPISTAVLHQGAAQGLAYDAFVVRKEPKDHGRGKQVEGPDLKGKRVALVSDAGTGFEKIKTALIQAGASVRSSALVGSHATRYMVPPNGSAKA